MFQRICSSRVLSIFPSWSSRARHVVVSVSLLAGSSFLVAAEPADIEPADVGSGGEAVAGEYSSYAPMLSPEQSVATMKIQPGYSVVPVLTEPDILEPADIVWDGNGRMYVLEMRTYMQDIDGSGKLKPVSRVSRHEDRDNDGTYETHSVFADNLVLPRMILPLLDGVLIGETNTLDIKLYRDTDNDGVADQIDVWHEGGARGGNLEHQQSGLIWNTDNWIYTTYTNYRYRFTRGKVETSPLTYNTGQWGLTQDDVGRMFYSTAGGENPAFAFQQPIVYGQLDLPGEQADGFREVFPIDDIPDVQGGPKRVRDDNTLTQFTGGGGQTVFLGDNLPGDFVGDLIICEPVGRLIRRAKVEHDHGRVVVANAYPGEEFIAATDPNFRPINSATGPDGSLYLVDMYRGIIQEAAWVREGSYLRDVVQKYELDKNIGRGRIFRVDHETTHRGEQPRMLDESPNELVKHLSNPNGWWRSEAQKLIILHHDLSVVPTLKTMATDAPEALTRLHAWWTLEGLDAIETSHLLAGFDDEDGRVRAAAMRIAEPMLASDRQFDHIIDRLGKDSDAGVVMQTLLSVSHAKHPDADALVDSIVKANASNRWVATIAKQNRGNRMAIEAEERKLAELTRRNKELAESVVRGKVIYSTLCATCHGTEGRGHHSPQDENVLLAPALVGSPRVNGHKERLLRILINGLMGPIENKTYADGLMMPLAANDDRWIADAANFIRNSWGNKASHIHSEDVGRVRQASASRVGPWTMNDLNYFDPPILKDRSNWKFTASSNTDKAGDAADGNSRTRWDTGARQTNGQWFAIEFPEPVQVMSVVLDHRNSRDDYPRGYRVEVSQDGINWTGPVARGSGERSLTMIEIDGLQPARHLRITQTGEDKRLYWSIQEIDVHAIPPGMEPPKSMADKLAEMPVADLAQMARQRGDADRGGKLFFTASLSCIKCHEPTSGPRLGPNLAEKRDGVTDHTLVEAVLDPSKEIHKDFAQVSVITADGLVLRGFPVSETDEEYILREPASGNEIRILQDDIDDVVPMRVSAMPAGLVNQLQHPNQFLDLVRFLIEVNEADNGAAVMQQYRPANR